MGNFQTLPSRYHGWKFDVKTSWVLKPNKIGRPKETDICSVQQREWQQGQLTLQHWLWRSESVSHGTPPAEKKMAVNARNQQSSNTFLLHLTEGPPLGFFPSTHTHTHMHIFLSLLSFSTIYPSRSRQISTLFHFNTQMYLFFSLSLSYLTFSPIYYLSRSR